MPCLIDCPISQKRNFMHSLFYSCYLCQIVNEPLQRVCVLRCSTLRFQVFLPHQPSGFAQGDVTRFFTSSAFPLIVFRILFSTCSRLQFCFFPASQLISNFHTIAFFFSHKKSVNMSRRIVSFEDGTWCIPNIVIICELE